MAAVEKQQLFDYISNNLLLLKQSTPQIEAKQIYDSLVQVSIYLKCFSAER